MMRGLHLSGACLAHQVSDQVLKLVEGKSWVLNPKTSVKSPIGPESKELRARSSRVTVLHRSLVRIRIKERTKARIVQGRWETKGPEQTNRVRSRGHRAPRLFPNIGRFQQDDPSTQSGRPNGAPFRWFSLKTSNAAPCSNRKFDRDSSPRRSWSAPRAHRRVRP
jgi:hypothetical protein